MCHRGVLLLLNNNKVQVLLTTVSLLTGRIGMDMVQPVFNLVLVMTQLITNAVLLEKLILL